MEKCAQCNGVGEIMETAYGDVPCPHCAGTGVEPQDDLAPDEEDELDQRDHHADF